MDIVDYIALPERRHYKCYEFLQKLLNSNKKFSSIIEEGIKEGKIRGFDESMWDKMENMNYRAPISFPEVFAQGFNVGNCTHCAYNYSYLIDNPAICGGTLPILTGTNNSADGRHTWVEIGSGKETYLIDTTLMMVISKDYASKIGYIEEEKVYPDLDPRYKRYQSAKEFANDPSIKRAPRKPY